MYLRLTEKICGAKPGYLRGIFPFLFLILTLSAPVLPAQTSTTNVDDLGPDDYWYDQKAAAEAEPGAANLTKLTTVEEVLRLKPEEAQQGHPVDIRGVVTCVVQEHNAFIIQDMTRAVFVGGFPGMVLPQRGESLDLQGKTDKGTFAPLRDPRQYALK